MFNPHRVAAGKTLFLEWLALLVPKRCESSVGTDRAVPSRAHCTQIEVKREGFGIIAMTTDLKWTDRAFIHDTCVLVADSRPRTYNNCGELNYQISFAVVLQS